MGRGQDSYFDYFNQGAELALKGAQILADLSVNLESVSVLAKTLHEIENQGDELFHKLCYQLNRDFVPPLERGDILALGNQFESLIDAIDEGAILFEMLGITSLSDSALALTRLIEKSCLLLVEAAAECSNLQGTVLLQELIIKVNSIEEEGDQIYQKAVKKLFSQNQDAVEIIKGKSVYDALEGILDSCEAVADTMEGILAKCSW